MATILEVCPRVALLPHRKYGRLSGDSDYYQRLLVEHWDGEGWSIVPTPDLNSDIEKLTDVVALPSGEVWAVGQQGNMPLALQWDGTQFNVVSTPDRPAGSNTLRGVEAISATDAWAVGQSRLPESAIYDKPLLEHWDGTGWSLAAVPPVSGWGSGLTGVSAISTDRAWAVGYYVHLNNPTLVNRPIVMGWNGTSWVVGYPEFGPDQTDGVIFRAIDVVSQDDFWIVGEHQSSYSVPVVVHVEKNIWMRVPLPGFGADNQGQLYGVSALSSNDVWAVGNVRNGNDAPNHTLIMHCVPFQCKARACSVPVAP